MSDMDTSLYADEWVRERVEQISGSLLKLNLMGGESIVIYGASADVITALREAFIEAFDLGWGEGWDEGHDNGYKEACDDAENGWEGWGDR
jgi:hypothetical protein